MVATDGLFQQPPAKGIQGIRHFHGWRVGHAWAVANFVVNLMKDVRTRGSFEPKPRRGGRRHARATSVQLASEQDRPDVKQTREEWTGVRQPKMRLEPRRLVFLDETGTTAKMTRLRGRCVKGQRFLSKAPFEHWQTQTFIAGLRCDALSAPWVRGFV
jgi:hypothetical protein